MDVSLVDSYMAQLEKFSHEPVGLFQSSFPIFLNLASVRFLLSTSGFLGSLMTRDSFQLLLRGFILYRLGCSLENDAVKLKQHKTQVFDYENIDYTFERQASIFSDCER